MHAPYVIVEHKLPFMCFVNARVVEKIWLNWHPSSLLFDRSSHDVAYLFCRACDMLDQLYLCFL